jgi:4-hydroxybenzoate polyprenyltransferase
MVLFFYSYTKRFTAFSHLFLGFAIGLAPLAAWIAATGSVDPRVLLLSLALMTYIAGFDILYACQDIEFDRSLRLFSMPACWGVHRGLHISSFLHGVTFLSLLALYFAFHLGAGYLLFLAVISVLLLWEHRLVRPDRLDKINFAFFHLNSIVSVLLFLAVWAGTSF